MVFEKKRHLYSFIRTHITCFYYRFYTIHICLLLLLEPVLPLSSFLLSLINSLHALSAIFGDHVCFQSVHVTTIQHLTLIFYIVSQQLRCKFLTKGYGHTHTHTHKHMAKIMTTLTKLDCHGLQSFSLLPACH